jgi:hypothetical protein
MSEGKKKKQKKATEAETQAVEPTASAVATPVNADPPKVRKAIALLQSHPLGLVAVVGAAVALVEIELAVGILTGIGATALLATKSGPEARQEVRGLGQEVVTRGKAALERARVALASRTKTVPAEPTAAPATASTEAAAPKADEPPAAAS